MPYAEFEPTPLRSGLASKLYQQRLVSNHWYYQPPWFDIMFCIFVRLVLLWSVNANQMFVGGPRTVGWVAGYRPPHDPGEAIAAFSNLSQASIPFVLYMHPK
jgi:hypothetical protein